MSDDPSGKRPRRAASAPRFVRASWDRLSWVYRPRGRSDDCFAHTVADYRRWLRPLVTGLPREAEVLDLGCGTGLPADRILAGRFRLTGVDVSDVMVRRARGNVPTARFRRVDMTEARFPPGSFDAVIALYSIIHVPRRVQRPLFRRVGSWLRPGGLLLAVLGHDAYEGVERDWLGAGVPMYWSHADAATYRRWLDAAGFTVLRQEFVPEGEGGHELFLARKRRRAPAGTSPRVTLAARRPTRRSRPRSAAPRA